MNIAAWKKVDEIHRDKERDAFRLAMRELAAGVGIVATGSERDRVGMTATAITSLSIDPPTLLVCINQSASIAERLHVRRHFSVNLLTAEQQEVAEVFAGKGGVKGADRFRTGHWTSLLTGAPVLVDALSSFECEIEDIVAQHTHLIVIGRVVAVRAGESGNALLHWRSKMLAVAAGEPARSV